jgi:hypothetical protein
MDFDFDFDGTDRQDVLPLSVTDGRVDGRLPPDGDSLSRCDNSAIADASVLEERNQVAFVTPASTLRCSINMQLAAEGAGIAADLRRRRISRSHKLDLLDDLRESRDILERAEWALEAAEAAVADAKADVANALFACEEAGCVDIAGEPLEEFS